MRIAVTLAASALLTLAACGKSQSTGADAGATDASAHAASVLKTIAPEDLAGFMSGNYHTSHNHPALYADMDRNVFVLIGRQGRAEIPLSKPDDAVRAYEQFLLLHGYEPNGKKASERPTIIVDGKPLVIVTMDELFPTMPPDIRKRFSAEQYDVLEHTDGRAGYRVVAATYPLMYAYSKSLVVMGPSGEEEHPIEKASDAFSAFEKLVAR
jgi:hypothetical protein